MIPDRIIQRLRRIVGENFVSTSRPDAEIYSYDASLARGAPDAVVFPRNTEEAVLIVRAACDAGIPFVPRGFGTNLSGGTILLNGGLVICLSRMNQILAIQPESRSAVVQPGVTNLELQTALQPYGFFYAPDPASQKVATLGGNVGENAGGPRCLKYGVTTNHVLGLEFVLAPGKVVRLGGAALDPPGYDLRGLVVGGEGTLGLATEIVVRILPKPQAVTTLLAVYDDIMDAAHSVSDIISQGIVPLTLEMMDSPIIAAIEDSSPSGYPRDAAAVLVIEVEGPSAGLARQVRHISELCMQNNCRGLKEAENEAQRSQLWEGRRGAFGAIARLSPSYLVNDCTVPRTKLPEALDLVARIAEKGGFRHGNVFHAGDGNLHPLIFFDSRDPGQLELVKKAGWEIMKACVGLGGSVTGEHGVGLEKMSAMRLMFSEEDFDVQRSLKRAFDPEDLINPGKVIPAPVRGGSGKELLDIETVPALPGHCPDPSEEEIARKIKDAAAQKLPVLPIGYGTRRDFGNTLTSQAVVIESLPLDRIFDLDPFNQYVIAGAGISLATLQAKLAQHQQWLPVRPVTAHQKHTIGGLVALGACGPERMAYGAPRDLLLGLRYINSQGQIILAGGKVVKNVAGYDMTRLLAGSAGTLGYITAVTFRTATMPEQCTFISGKGVFMACASVAAQVLESNLEPVYVTAFPETGKGRNLSQHEWTVRIGFEGFSENIEYQLKKAGERLQTGGITSQTHESYPVHTPSFGQKGAAIEGAPFILRADVPLHHLPEMVRGLDDLGPFSALLCDFGCGRIVAGLSAVSDSEWDRLCTLAVSLMGHLFFEKAPVEFKELHDVFGAARPEWRIMHKIKDALDPYGTFSPGRLPGKGMI